jgi:ATP-dependent Clp protease protease subunit
MASWYAIRARGPARKWRSMTRSAPTGSRRRGFWPNWARCPRARRVDLRLNSPGGSVFDAVAIHNALKRHEGTVTVWIDGIAASAASYIAMAGDEIVMPENAFLMIHDPAGLVMGTAEDMRAMAEALDKVKGSLVSGYAAKSGRTPEEVSALMAAETWFDAADAVAQGFADRLIEPVRIAARFDIGRFRNAPPVLVEAVEAEPEPRRRERRRRDRSGRRHRRDADGDQVEDAEDEPAAAPTPSQPPAETPPPSGAPPDPAAIRAEAIGHARAVVDLCRLAGQPQMAGASSSRTPASTRCAPRSSPRRPRPSPRSRPITRSPAASLGRAPLGRDRRPHLQAERMTP